MGWLSGCPVKRDFARCFIIRCSKSGSLATERKRGSPDCHNRLVDSGKTGGVPERLNGPVLKTGVLHGTLGSNPSPTVISDL